MYTPLKNRLRKDLIITSIDNKETLEKRYLIKDPTSGETFEFGEEEYFLCESMDGNSTPSKIVANFKDRFGLAIAEEDFNEFSKQMVEFGILESLNEPVLPAVSVSTTSISLEKEGEKISSSSIHKEDNKPESPAKQQHKKNKIEHTYIWAIPNPAPKFTLWASIFKPLGKPAVASVWALIPGLPLALFTFFNNQSIFWKDLFSSVEPLPFLSTYLFNVTFASLTAKLAQGLVFAYYGGRVKKFGLILAAGFFPRFYVDREGMWQLKRNQQLWVFATPLVSRLVYFVIAVLTWYWTRSTGTELRTFALLLAHASFVDFLLDGCPLWPVDGYVFMVAYWQLPLTFLQRAYLVWEMILTRRPLPQSLSFREKLILLLYGPAAIVFWLSMVSVMALTMGKGLSENFTGIFGRATAAILIGAVIAAASRQPIAFFRKKLSQTTTFERPPRNRESELKKGDSTRFKSLKSWKRNLTRIILILGFLILLLLPYPYRPGGQIQLLPPTQQAIQVQVEGQIIKVMFKGGDGQWIKAGTPVALMEAIDIENNVLTQQEQIQNQQAIVAKQQANLNKLLATPRKEDVEVAKQQVEVAKQNVEVARQQVEVAKQNVEVAKKKLDTAISTAEFSTREASRFEALYKSGVVSQQAYEDKRKQAETDRINVEENRQNVAAKQQEVESSRNELATKQQTVAQRQANLALVLSGPYPDEIQAARKDVEAAQAGLKRQQQQLKYDQEQLRRTQLVMPIDGYLVTSYLEQKVGSYLKKGQTFAVAEDDRHITGEVRIPEYNVGEFTLGASTEVKLLAYPDRPFIGKVVSIEPAASAENSPSTTVKEPTANITDRFVRVIIDIPNRDKILKSSMTGYAKIDGSTKPVIVAFTRPIVRFIQVEVWSWIP